MKASVSIFDDGTIKCYSYGALVIELNTLSKYRRVLPAANYSATTQQHVRAFWSDYNISDYTDIHILPIEKYMSVKEIKKYMKDPLFFSKYESVSKFAIQYFASAKSTEKPYYKAKHQEALKKALAKKTFKHVSFDLDRGLIRVPNERLYLERYDVKDLVKRIQELDKNWDKLVLAFETGKLKIKTQIDIMTTFIRQHVGDKIEIIPHEDGIIMCIPVDIHPKKGTQPTGAFVKISDGLTKVHEIIKDFKNRGLV